MNRPDATESLDTSVPIDTEGLPPRLQEAADIVNRLSPEDRADFLRVAVLQSLPPRGTRAILRGNDATAFVTHSCDTPSVRSEEADAVLFEGAETDAQFLARQARLAREAAADRTPAGVSP